MNDKTINIKKVPQLRFPEFEGEWVEKKLGDVAETIGGGTPDTSKKDYWNGDIVWLTPTEIKEKYISDSIRKISKLGLQKSSAKLLPKGTLLFTSRATIGDVGIAEVECSTNQGFQSFIPNDNYDTLFLYNWIIKNRKEFIRKASGSTFLEISKTSIATIKITLPTPPEQTKIANFLTAVDKRINLLQKKKAELEQYKNGVMQKLFSQEIRFKQDDGSDFPDWEEKKLGEVCNYLNGGSFEKLVVENGTYNLITLNSIDINGKLKKSHKKVNKTDNSLKKNDLIMVLSDVAHGNFLGLTDIIPDDTFVLNQRMGALKPKVEINRYYLKTFINYNQKYFKLMGQGSSQQNLSKGDILKFIVLIPHKEEQQKIANFLSSIDKSIEKVSSQIEQSQKWKQGLLQKMFV